MSEPSYRHASLAAALVAAQQQAQAVAKSSENTFHRYKYASAEALIAEAREALANHGLAVMPLEWAVVPVTDIAGVASKVVVTYLLLHEAGASVTAKCETSILPEKGRPQDKAEATALTYNLGYYLRGLLLLPREDPALSVDGRDDRHDSNPKSSPTGSPNSAQSSPKASSSKPAAQPTEYSVAAAISDIQAASSVADLGAIRAKAKAAGLVDESVRAAYAARQAEIKGAK